MHGFLGYIHTCTKKSATSISVHLVGTEYVSFVQTSGAYRTESACQRRHIRARERTTMTSSKHVSYYLEKEVIYYQAKLKLGSRM